MSGQRLSVKLSDTDKNILVDLVSEQFVNIYRITNNEMSLGERLIFDKLHEYVADGFCMKLDELVDDER